MWFYKQKQAKIWRCNNQAELMQGKYRHTKAVIRLVSQRLAMTCIERTSQNKSSNLEQTRKLTPTNSQEQNWNTQKDLVQIMYPL